MNNNRSKFNKKAFGDVVSTLIMFIAIVGLSTGIVVAFQQYVSQTQDSMRVQNDVTSNKLKTILSITNVNYNSTSDQLFVYVRNIGQTVLEGENFDLFLNDVFIDNFLYTEPTNFTLQKNILQPQETIVFIINQTLNPGSSKIRVVSQYGVGEDLSFNI